MGRKRHPKTDEIYEFIVSFKQKNDGISPSIREIREGCEITSVSMILERLEELVADNRIAFLRKNMTRGIMVVGGTWRGPQNH